MTEQHMEISCPPAKPDILEIVFQDEHFVAINKPTHLLVHASIIDRHEKRNAKTLLENQLGKPVYNIHRLDKPTSGIMIFAFHPEAAKKGVESFTQTDNKKAYLAVVRGFTDQSGIIDTPLAPVADKLLKAKKKQGTSTKNAITQYRTLAKYEMAVTISRYSTSRYSLLEVHPKTGRMHQIRRHLKHIRHPIIGDTKYGDHNHNRYFRETLDCQRLLLAAAELMFFHPYTKSPVTITARLDSEFARLIQKFGWKDAIPGQWLNEEIF
jgi:tRNA pseudouridine65 synthase